MVAAVTVRMKPELKKLLLQMKRARGSTTSIGEVCLDLICKQLQRDDLNEVPRKSFGRPSNEIQDDSE